MLIKDYEYVGKEFIMTLAVLCNDQLYRDIYDIFAKKGENMTNLGLMREFEAKIKLSRIMAQKKNKDYYIREILIA